MLFTASWTTPDSIAFMVAQTMIGAWDKVAGPSARSNVLGQEYDVYLYGRGNLLLPWGRVG